MHRFGTRNCIMGQLLGTAAEGATDEIKKMVRDMIEKHKVVVYSKSYCPYCVEVKNLLKSLNMEFTAIELDKEENGPAIQGALVEMTGQRTVPNVFINGTYVGGCDKTKAAHAEGRLMQLYNK